jgi:tRNA(Ile)-lysidine synthetase-like protein
VGMQGKGMKLSDFMINARMPRSARDRWPIVTRGGEILWVPGYRLAYGARLKESTSRVVKLELLRVDV